MSDSYFKSSYKAPEARFRILNARSTYINPIHLVSSQKSKLKNHLFSLQDQPRPPGRRSHQQIAATGGKEQVMRSRFWAHRMQNRNASPHPGSEDYWTISSMKIKINSGIHPCATHPILYRNSFHPVPSNCYSSLLDMTLFQTIKTPTVTFNQPLGLYVSL